MRRTPVENLQLDMLVGLRRRLRLSRDRAFLASAVSRKLLGVGFTSRVGRRRHELFEHGLGGGRAGKTVDKDPRDAEHRGRASPLVDAVLPVRLAPCESFSDWNGWIETCAISLTRPFR